MVRTTPKKTCGPSRSTRTGDWDRTRSTFWTSPSVSIVVCDEEDDWNSESGEDDGDSQGCDEVEEVIHPTSVAGDSVKSISIFPERNEDNTDWLCQEGMKDDSDFNKMKTEDITVVCKRKEILSQEVVKNGSLVDH